MFQLQPYTRPFIWQCSTGHTEASEQALDSPAHTRAKQESKFKSSGLYSAVSNAVTCLFNTTKTCLKQGTPTSMQTLSLHGPLDQYFMHFTESQAEKQAKAWNKGSWFQYCAVVSRSRASNRTEKSVNPAVMNCNKSDFTGARQTPEILCVISHIP